MRPFTVSLHAGVAVLLLTNLLFAGPVSLSSRLSRTASPLNKSFELELELKWEGPADLYAFEGLEAPPMKNLTITGSRSSNRAAVEDGKPVSVQTLVYQLQGQELGMAYLEPLRVRAVNKETGESQILGTERLEVKIEEPEEPFEFPWLHALLTLLAGAAVAGAWWLRKMRTEEASRKNQQVDLGPTPEEEFSRLLREEVHLESDDFKTETVSLSRLLKRFIGRRFSISNPPQLTDDLVKILEDFKVSEATKSEVCRILREADTMKFSMEPMTRAQFENLYTRVETLLSPANKAFNGGTIESGN